jgi:hypothetical protein
MTLFLFIVFNIENLDFSWYNKEMMSFFWFLNDGTSEQVKFATEWHTVYVLFPILEMAFCTILIIQQEIGKYNYFFPQSIFENGKVNRKTLKYKLM